jgi:hypothetical protein
MATMDVFKADGFSMMELSSMVEDMDYNPQMLGSMNLFTPSPVRQKTVFIDRESDTLNLIGFSERGAPPEQNSRYSRNMLPLTIPRLAVQDTVWAHEIAGLRATGTESELMSVQREVTKRLASMRQKVEYTKEYLRLAAIQGLALDPADGSTYYNYYTEFGVTQDTATSFELDQAGTDVAGICRELVRSIMRSAKGAWVMGQSSVHALVGDDFFDALVTHPNVEKFWVNWQASAELRNIDPFSEFTFGGITFHNYRGSDDNSEIAIAVAEAKFFVVGGDGIFVEAMAPADEFMPYVNTLGQSVYAVQELDSAFAATPRFAKYHVHSYPLMYCQRPGTLRRGTLT